jgi:hypothetical protein
MGAEANALTLPGTCWYVDRATGEEEEILFGADCYVVTFVEV